MSAQVAIIGSYGHVGVVLAGLKQVPGASLVAVAKWGPDDPLAFLAGWRGQPVVGPTTQDKDAKHGHARERVHTAVAEGGGEPGHAKGAAGVAPALYDDYRRMLDDVRPDVAAVFMPLYRLAKASTAAAQRGCHVFSEKPLATTLADLDRLRRSASKAGVKVVACMTARGEPAFLSIRKAVLAGRIGRCLCATAQKSYPFATRDDFYKARQTYGGSIPWQAIHALDYISYCTGQDYRRVAALAGNLAHPSHPGMEDQGGLVAELSGGGTAVVNFDYLRPWGAAKRPWGDDRLRIAGTDGIIETRNCASAVELLTPDGAEMLPLEPPRNVFADFLTCLRGENTACKQPVPPLITPEESFRITEVALKAREAQDAGATMEV